MKYGWLALLLWLVCTPALARQVLHHGNGPEPETLDPHRSEGVSAANILRDLYEGLTSLSPQGQVIPGAAERWAITPDGRRYTFTLRPGLRWSDGSAVVAEDFVAGLRRTVDPALGSAFAQILAPIENAEAIAAGSLPVAQLGVLAPDARTVVIRLRAPTPYFLGLLSHATTYPIHRPSLQRWGRDFARPQRLIGNGAYALHGWVVQSAVTLRRNPHYWNNAATQVEEVHYHTTEDINAELKRYQADEFDSTYEVPLVRAPELRARYGSELRVAPYLGSYFYGFNVTRPPFANNPALRQALSMALDREIIVAKVMNGLALPAYTFVPPGVWNYQPQRPAWADWPRERRLAEARRLYALAGYSAERPLTMELRYNTHDGHRRIAIVAAAMWKQWLGVRTTLVNEEFKVFIANRRLRKITELVRQAWISDYDDAGSFLDTLHSANGQNDSGYASPAYDALVTQAGLQADPAQRRALFEKAERLLLADAPVLPVYTYVSKHLVKPWVQGWHDNPQDVHYSKDLRVLPH